MGCVPWPLLSEPRETLQRRGDNGTWGQPAVLLSGWNCDSERPAAWPPLLQSSQLFDGARQRFLDALLVAARVEAYLPNVSSPLHGKVASLWQQCLRHSCPRAHSRVCL